MKTEVLRYVLDPEDRINLSLVNSDHYSLVLATETEYLNSSYVRTLINNIKQVDVDIHTFIKPIIYNRWGINNESLSIAKDKSIWHLMTAENVLFLTGFDDFIYYKKIDDFDTLSSREKKNSIKNKNKQILFQHTQSFIKANQGIFDRVKLAHARKHTRRIIAETIRSLEDSNLYSDACLRKKGQSYDIEESFGPLIEVFSRARKQNGGVVNAIITLYKTYKDQVESVESIQQLEALIEELQQGVQEIDNITIGTEQTSFRELRKKIHEVLN